MLAALTVKDLGLPRGQCFGFYRIDPPGPGLIDAVFERMAEVSGGATVPFDASSADRLRQLLGAVARFARGGLKALRDSGAAGDRLLLDQLEKGP